MIPKEQLYKLWIDENRPLRDVVKILNISFRDAKIAIRFYDLLGAKLAMKRATVLNMGRRRAPKIVFKYVPRNEFRVKWIKFRLIILQRDHFKCRRCGKIAKVIHHIKSRKEFPELIFDENNVIALCKSCHGKIHYLYFLALQRDTIKLIENIFRRIVFFRPK